MTDIAKLVDNDVAVKTSRYAAIVGATPSRGSRSVELWNRAYSKFHSDCRMLPLDVSPKSDLGEVVSALRVDERYIGGAVALPYKSAIAPLLDRLEPEAAVIGAVNCIYRDGVDLIGANTDGAGALSSLTDVDLSETTVLVIGIGGAGKAVAAYVAPEAKATVLTGRSLDAAKALTVKLPRTSVRPIADLHAVLPGTGVIINCTSCGFEQGTSAGLTPLSARQESVANNAEARELLALLPKPAVVFDIIYLPTQTPLLRLAADLGHRTINGIAMNREQAVLAFMKTNSPRQSAAEIRQVFL